MAKKHRVSRNGQDSGAVLRDGDWITIIAALLKDTNADSRALANRLLARSKPGRQMRLLRIIRRQKPTLSYMAGQLGVSRRTVFRYLNDLELYGVRLRMDEAHRYHLDQTPAKVLRLL